MDDKDYEDLNWYKDKYGPRITTRGLHNWKNLFRKPTLNEWVAFICIVLVLFTTFAYKIDMNNCQAQIEDILTHPYKYLQLTYNEETQGNPVSIPFPLQIVQGLLS